ncbi:MAG: hypothetical protein AABX47_08390 [Nanoarchaeota archaeon]
MPTFYKEDLSERCIDHLPFREVYDARDHNIWMVICSKYSAVPIDCYDNQYYGPIDPYFYTLGQLYRLNLRLVQPKNPLLDGHGGIINLVYIHKGRSPSERRS